MPTKEIPQPLLEQIRRCRSIMAFTGAGISAESGVPTFRDAQTGLWAQFSPLDLATPEAFKKHPQRVWEWYEWRRSLVNKVSPNAGHKALTKLLQLFPINTLVTQNVDGLHQASGTDTVLELHGNIHRTICSRDRTMHQTWEPEVKPPRCPDCGAHLRPDVVWFGESLPADTFDGAIRAAQNCELFLSIGTSTTVYPAAELPHTAKNTGALVIEINPTPTPFTAEADWAFAAPAGEFLPHLVERMEALARS